MGGFKSAPAMVTNAPATGNAAGNATPVAYFERHQLNKLFEVSSLCPILIFSFMFLMFCSLIPNAH